MRLALAALLLAACAPPPAAPPPVADQTPAGSVPTDTVRADWARFFEAEGGTGTFVLLDVTTGQTSRLDPARAATRYSPASTSKVFNGLVFLDRGVLRDPDSLAAWDGVERWLPAWNQDHSLRSATNVSAVWFFQRFALKVGREGYADVFARQPYGNSTLSDTLENSWLDGTWRISADEQVAFFDALRRGALAFRPEHQATIREVLPLLDEGDGWRLKAKTGWAILPDSTDFGWLVGWVERPEGDVVFAMNVEDAGEGALDLGPARLRIARALLAAEGWLE